MKTNIAQKRHHVRCAGGTYRWKSVHTSPSLLFPLLLPETVLKRLLHDFVRLLALLRSDRNRHPALLSHRKTAPYFLYGLMRSSADRLCPSSKGLSLSHMYSSHRCSSISCLCASPDFRLHRRELTALALTMKSVGERWRSGATSPS